MDRYERFSDFIRMLSIFTAIFLVDAALKRFPNLDLPDYLSVTLKGITAVAVLHVAEFFSEWAFDTFAWIRRFALGDDYLEGLWIDVMVGAANFGLISISYKNGKLRMNGEQYDQSCNLITSWENFLIDMEGRTVRTMYRSPKNQGTPLSEALGFSTYIFSGNPGRPPDRYNGYFSDSTAPNERCALRGYRILNKKTLASLRSTPRRNAELLRIYREVTTKP